MYIKVCEAVLEMTRENRCYQPEMSGLFCHSNKRCVQLAKYFFFSFTNASCPSWVRVNSIQYHSASGAQVSSVALRSFFFAITEEKADSLGKLVISTYVLVGK